MVQDSNAPNSPPDSEMVLPPLFAVKEPELSRSQSVKGIPGFPIDTAAGSTSVNDKSVTGDADPLVMVKVISECDPELMLLGIKTLDKDG